MLPEQILTPEHWMNLPEEKKQEESLKGPSYAYLNYFIYDKHPNLPPYNFKDGTKTDYYMIDFRMIYSLNCDKILKPDKVPIETKWLQLSIQSRAELREKLVHYFGRIPVEDMVD